MDKCGCALMPTYVDKRLIHIVKGLPTWKKWFIKRKYGKYPEISIDVWTGDCLRSILSLIPKRTMEKVDWKFKRRE